MYAEIFFNPVSLEPLREELQGPCNEHLDPLRCGRIELRQRLESLGFFEVLLSRTDIEAKVI